MKKRTHNRRKENTVKSRIKAVTLVVGKAGVRGNEFLSRRAIAMAATSTKADTVDRLKRAGILTKSGGLATRYK